MDEKQIRGVVVPIMTPLTPDEEVDVTSLRRLVNYLIDNGVHGIWAAGTNGEFAALTDEQQVLCIQTIADEVSGRVPVIGNISSASSRIAAVIGLAVQESGLDGVAATPPYYYANAQDELLEHFRYIKGRVGLPLWVYNIPVTVKTTVEPPTIAQLAAEGTVVGVKDSSHAGEKLAHLNVLCEQGDIQLYRFIGSMYRITTARAVGAHGVIPGLANLVPGIASRAWEAGESGDQEAARGYNLRLIAATGIMRLANGGSQQAAGISGIKSALKVMGIIKHDTVTRPFRPLTDEEKEPVPSLLRELGLNP